MNNNDVIKPIFSDKPYSVPVEMRPLWRICLVVISILVVSGEKKFLSSKKVNILVWMLIRKNKWQDYEDFLLDRSESIPLISVDTATFKAIEFAIAKEIICVEGDKILVKKGGDELFSTLVNNDVMYEEISFLQRLGKKLSERKVNILTGGVI